MSLWDIHLESIRGKRAIEAAEVNSGLSFLPKMRKVLCKARKHEASKFGSVGFFSIFSFHFLSTEGKESFFKMYLELKLMECA